MATFTFSFTQKKEGVRSSETHVNTYNITQRQHSLQQNGISCSVILNLCLAVGLRTWQHISYLVHIVNQGAGKFGLTTHTNPFKAIVAR
jgi:hypothetical protein